MAAEQQHGASFASSSDVITIAPKLLGRRFKAAAAQQLLVPLRTTLVRTNNPSASVRHATLVHKKKHQKVWLNGSSKWPRMIDGIALIATEQSKKTTTTPFEDDFDDILKLESPTLPLH